MGDYTATTDMTLEAAITAGSMVDGEELEITNGAVVTCTQTPSILLGNVIVEYGEFFIDGVNISSGNAINFLGEGGYSSGANDMTVTVKGQGLFKVEGDWFDIGTTDGTDSQVIDLSSATGVDLFDGDKFISNIPMIQVETGRRINFTGGSGVTPAIGDWVYLTSDRTVMGKIKTVESTYIVVWCLTDSIASGVEIQIRSIVDNEGPDLQKSWTATTNGVDVLESGVYMEFGNAVSDSNNYISGFGHGLGGLVFAHLFETTDLIMGSSAGGGFVPPSGCNIRVPNIMINTSDVVNFPLNKVYRDSSNTDEQELYGMEITSGGSVELSVCNVCNAYFWDTGGYHFEASYVGAIINIGNSAAVNTIYLDHCVVVQDPVGSASPSYGYFGMVDNAPKGTYISFCLMVSSRVSQMGFGGSTSSNLHISDCIHTSAGQGTQMHTSSTNAYRFLYITDGSITNCMAFGSNHSEDEHPVYLFSTTNINISMLLYSATQDYTGGTVSGKYTARILYSNNIRVIGLEMIGNGSTSGQMFIIADCQDVYVRCFGMIDDKVDLGSNSSGVVATISGLSSNVNFARLWVDSPNSRITEFYVGVNTNSDISITNCSHAYSSGIETRGNGGIRIAGLHGAAGTPGNGSEGWEEQYQGSYGNNFHDSFKSDTAGIIACLFITPTTENEEDIVTIITGSPLFYKDGTIDMLTDDVLILEMGYWCKGHIAFSGGYTTAVGGAAWNADEFSNIDLDFQYDTGSGWNGTWLNLRTSSNLTSIADMVDGFKIKIRMTANAAYTNMSMILLDTTTTLAAQAANLYPIDQDEVDINLSGIAEGSVVAVYKDSDDSEIISPTAVGATGIVTDTYIYSTDVPVTVKVRKGTSGTKYLPYNAPGTISSTGFSLIVSQVEDSIVS